MTAQRRYDLLMNESEAVGFDDCKLRVVVAVAAATARMNQEGKIKNGAHGKRDIEHVAIEGMERVGRAT